MTLTLKPKGRGNWSAVTLVISGRRVEPLLVHRGQTLMLAGVLWRIAKVAT